MVETHPSTEGINSVTQVMVGWWWVLCIIITTAYRSSLISHLTVPGITRPINTFDDLLALEGWSWSAETGILNMADRDFFLGSPSPVVREVYRLMQVQGAPFLDAIKRLKQRLLESGLLAYWLSDVIKQRVRETPRNSREGQDASITQALLPSLGSGEVVLGIGHLQGVFYFLFAGFMVSVITLMCEQAFVLTSTTREVVAITKGYNGLRRACMEENQAQGGYFRRGCAGDGLEPSVFQPYPTFGECAVNLTFPAALATFNT
ncbi:hypothetical protein E2C01_002573 [Portunus trituberculatus]|uniref:Ionotropic glutamate receptor C-terminal domain-containing protein n=1 Tax=Portunus trituberculatus TaxID=210409 RepID=A0A5B7CR45_PORTR|nr:hypothetical protein [Portunus trituberculatus]